MIRGWLLLLGVLVYLTVLVGGATRLTDSGLSITEWAPLSGALPPLSQSDWDAAFALYRETAEYRLQNKGMSLSEFQFIYWWEWGHRQLGRVIGLVALIGLGVFALRGWLRNGLGWRITGLVALGGLQGAIGWWMVASGVGDTDRIDVAPYRLMTHFSLALLILCVIFWFWKDLGSARSHRGGTRAQILGAWALLALTGVQMAAGALVAGLDAGRSYTDWPLMHGEFFPSDYWVDTYGARNPFENRANVQFNHRALAYVLWAVALVLAWTMRRSAHARGFALVAALVTAQALWGILTLVSAAPLGLALVHQGLGVIVLLSTVHLAWSLTPARSDPQPPGAA
jgi:cytochrome c oxidase assembly protein subunit 15